jgi:pyrimidine-nucleoside phosphorylase
MDAERIGTSASLLGAGRIEKDDVIDYAAGIVLSKKTGDFVKAGETLAVLCTSNESLLADAEGKFLSAFTYSKAPIALEPTIYDVL